MDVYKKFGARPIHLVHIRKTGGTSLNYSFMALSGIPPDRIWGKMREGGSDIVNEGSYRFVTRNKDMIESGLYTYSHAHIPFHELKFRADVFTVCSLRDPVDRLCSHYRMVREYLDKGIQKEWLRRESKWIGSGLVDFCKNMPEERLEAQLYCFSEEGNVDEALGKANEVSFLFRFHKFDESITELGNALELNLASYHERESGNTNISEEEKSIVRQMVLKEGEFLEKII